MFCSHTNTTSQDVSYCTKLTLELDLFSTLFAFGNTKAICTCAWLFVEKHNDAGVCGAAGRANNLLQGSAGAVVSLSRRRGSIINFSGAARCRDEILIISEDG